MVLSNRAVKTLRTLDVLEASAALQTAWEERNAGKPNTKPNTWSTAGEEC